MKIERNMIYDDEGQNLHINFKAGETVKLDGQKAYVSIFNNKIWIKVYGCK